MMKKSVLQNLIRAKFARLVWLVAAWLCAFPVLCRADYTATVNPSSVLVTNFQGWGTSLCWWANVIGGYPNRNDYVNLAFSNLKLNIVRYNIGGGENPTNNFLSYRATMQGFESSNGVWNWNADLNQRWVLQAALARGANLVDAFANSPPYWMTVSGSVTGAVGATNNLQVADENLFTTYLATVVSNLTVLDGDHFNYVTPMNEPVGTKWTYGGSQEGCDMSASQQIPVVNSLRAALNASLPSAGIDASEDVDPYQTVSAIETYPTATLNDVTLLTTHTYSETGNTSLASEANSLSKPLWVAEYGDSDGTGLTMAQRIHDDITIMGARAWVYWQFVDSATGWGFLYNPLVSPTNSTFTTSYTYNEKFYVMGQFSQFIRPGCQIISVNDTATLAAYTPSNSSLILVAINTNSASVNVTYNLSAFGAVPWQIGVAQTSANESGTPLASLTVVNQKFTYAIPAQSVTTFTLTTNAVLPVITNQTPAPPANAIQLVPGETCVLSTSAVGSIPLSYQWYSNGVPDSGATGVNYNPSTNLALNSVTLYNCVVSNAAGAVSSIVWTVSVLSRPTAFYPQAVLGLNPTGYWPMHEVETAALGDIETNYGTLGVLGNGYYPDWGVNQGYMIRGAPGAIAGDADSAVFFNATTPGGGNAQNGLFVPHTSPQATLIPPFTLECWIYATNHAAVGVSQGDVLSQADGSKNQGFRLYDQNAATVNYTTIFYKAGIGTQFNFNGGLATNQWHHLVLTCDANSNVVTYTDGSQSTPGSGSSAGSVAGKYNLEIHQPFTVGNGLGNGRSERAIIDEVAFYPSNLLASDIGVHYNDGLYGAAGQYFSDVTNDNPEIYLRMDSPYFTAPPVSSWPLLMNYGGLNNVAANGGSYSPGTMPGAVVGSAYTNFPPSLLGANVALLSGVSSYADAGYAAAYNPIGAAQFSVSAIFRGNPTDTNRVQSIVGHGTNSWELGMTVGGSLVFNSGVNSAAVVATGSGSGDLVSTINGFDDGNWHQVIASHFGTTNMLYIDGVANNTNVLSGANNTGNNLDVIIGSDPSYTNNPIGLGRQFAGQICEVAFFTNALSAAQAQSLYIAAVALPAVNLLLSIQSIASGQIVLNWNAGILQTAASVTGPYSDITNVSSPLTVAPTNAQQFYRIRESY